MDFIVWQCEIKDCRWWNVGCGGIKNLCYSCGIIKQKQGGDNNDGMQ